VSASGNRSTGPISERPLGARSRKSYTMLGLIVTIVMVGLVAGALARLLVPGKQHLSIAMTIVLGVTGSFVGGFLGYLIFHKDATDGFLQPSGIIGSVIGAVIVLLIWTRVGGRSSMRTRSPTGTTNLGQASPRGVYPTMVRAF
jgi:uncharacterized membrane protein YeaQ/YmgE (transglycosylase-associated protein family)